MAPLIKFPIPLPKWAETLASIIPLSGLIEFVDVETSIHVYELRGGSVPFWNWPITPAGARILVSDQGAVGDCLLDQPQRSLRMACIDGRYGNSYPCSAPATTRLWADTQPIDKEIKNTSQNMNKSDKREQVLRVFQVHGDATPTLDQSIKSKKMSLSQKFTSPFSKHGGRYLMVSLLGSFLWIGLVIVSFMGKLYLAGAYLLLMPVTCFVVGFTHGIQPRKPVIRELPSYPRLVIAAGSENSLYWYAFEGPHTILNGLLNISLEHTKRDPRWRFFQLLLNQRSFFLILLTLCILGQWAMVLGSSALSGWDAFIISIWTAFCIFMSSYGYPVDVAAKEWLTKDCKFTVRTIKATLSSRSALLIALATINPDTPKSGARNPESIIQQTKWMDTIVDPSDDRTDMWKATIDHLGGTALQNPNDPDNPWWKKYVEEGVKIGTDIKKTLDTDATIVQNEPPTTDQGKTSANTQHISSP